MSIFVTPWTISCQTPLSIGFSRQEYWSGLPFPPPKESTSNRTRASCFEGRLTTYLLEGGKPRILIPRNFTVSIVVDRLKGSPQDFYCLVLKFMWNSLTLSCDRTCQFSHSGVSDSLWPHELQHIKLPCPSTTPRACSNSHSLSQWCHPTISSSVVPFSCFQSFPASGSFQWISSLHQVAKVLEFHLQH